MSDPFKPSLQWLDDLIRQIFAELSALIASLFGPNGRSGDQ
jgi:hypothetical protein